MSSYHLHFADDPYRTFGAYHVHTADNVELNVHLAPVDSYHAMTSPVVKMTSPQFLAPGDTSHTHAAESVVLELPLGAVDDAYHRMTSGLVGIITPLTMESAYHAMTSTLPIDYGDMAIVVPGLVPSFTADTGRVAAIAFASPEITSGFTSGAGIALTVPDILFESAATDGLLGSLQIALFPPTFTSLCGARAAQVVPSLDVAFTASTGGTASLAMALPAWTFAATGTVNTLADISFTLPKITAAMVGVPQPTAAIEAEYPRISVSFSAVLGEVSALGVTVPSITAALTGRHEPDAALAMLVPPLKAQLYSTVDARFCSVTLEYTRPT